MKLNILSSRLKSYKKYLDEETFKKVVKNLNLPSTDFVTKSGGISESKKLWSSVSPYEKKSLESKELPTLTELKKDARESLEESGVMETLSGRKQISEAIQVEVSSKISVNDTFESAIEQWYEFVRTFGVELQYEYPEINELEDWLYSKGLKSWTEISWWMQRVEEVINKALRG